MTPGVPAAAPGVPAAAAAAPAVPAAAAAADAVALQKQIDELKEQVAEGQRSSQYWADKARAGTPKAAAEPVEEEPDVLEAITTGGVKGFDALAKKRGFIQRNEVEELINSRAASLTEEQQLLTEYPDLKNKGSDFFKATAAEYGRLVKSNVPQAVAMGQAARATELEFIKAGKIKLPGSETAAEKETARLARIAAQGGDSSARRPGAGSEDDDVVNSDDMVGIKMMASALEIPIEEATKRYTARAKKGVQVGLRMGR